MFADQYTPRVPRNGMREEERKGGSPESICQRKFILSVQDRNPLLHAFFFISNDFISNTRLKLAYFLAIFKQHPQAENRVLEVISIEIN